MSKSTKVIFMMGLGIFLCMLDTTVMNIALPAIQTGLDTDLTHLSWALNSYTILFASLSIPLGRLAELYGRTKIYLIGLGLFLLGSLSSGIAGSVSGLIIGRSIQSVGAAIVFPASMTIGIQAVSLEHRTGAIAILGVTQGLAAALGPTIGGVVTQLFGWRGIFLLNVPLVIVALIGCWLLLDRQPVKRQTVKLDFLGSGLSMLTLASLTLVLVKGSDWGWTSLVIISLGLMSILALLGFIIVETKVAQPMIPLDLFKNRQFDGAAIVTIISGIFLVALLVLMPSFFTRVQAKSELMAALMITPASIMIFGCSPVSGLFLTKVGPRTVIGLGSLAMIGGYWQLSVMDPNNYLQVMLAEILIGGGYGIIIGPITVLAAADFTGDLLTASQSVIGVFRQIGTSLAVAIFVSALSTNLVTAKNHIWQTAQEEVATLAVSSKAKQDTLAKVRAQLASGKSPSKTVQPPITARMTRKLIAAGYVAALKRQRLMAATTTVKAQVHLKVSQAVMRQVRRTNQRLIPAVRKIKHQTKVEITQAFIKPYQTALPFTVLMLGTIVFFERRRNYLNRINHR
ncbi:MFS transporter [Lactiplantibacillus nangangensis]|uniref:MFS transporter n=1 Tax=Lactiplantibacillus nangangensis TaxID=2559917 RepID=A0ABW1SJK8_9LACO|nr:MFS transporter [Lactiplantibacillus nangangensis]